MLTATADPPKSYSIDDYCKLEGISRAKAYRLWQHGKGPERYRSGSQWRVTAEALRAFREKNKAAA